MLAGLEKCLHAVWYKSRVAGYSLLPLAGVFCLLSLIRQQWLRLRSRVELSRPVIVVGNITVGGTGKTPLVIAIVEYLQAQGLKPGVVSRGYGGKANYPLPIDAATTAAQAGDESLLIARRCGCPVVVSPDRVQAARYLLANNDIDLIVSDDGLQHYSLPRQIEIAVVDGERGLGNGLCLPAGPLRERAGRLATVDFVVVNGGSGHSFPGNQFAMSLSVQPLRPLRPQQAGQEPQPGSAVHAVAAIGNPARFFRTVEQQGFQVTPHAFADHHFFSEKDLLFSDGYPVLMTEKDAVKCMTFPRLTNHWYLPVTAVLPEGFWSALQARLEQLAKGSQS